MDDSRLITRPFPSLSHLATVAVALPLLKDFDIKTLDDAFSEIQLENSTASCEGGEKDLSLSYKRARIQLLFIPSHLRKRVLEAVHGLYRKIKVWKYWHRNIFKIKDRECSLQWKSNGTIDTIKIAERLTLDQGISILKRFDIACAYCLERSVKMLWAEMKPNGQTKYAENPDNLVVRFWVRWLREGCREPWTQAASEYFEVPGRNARTPFTRFCAFFPSLRPEERRRFLFPLLSSVDEDLRSCLFTMTKEEQEEMLRIGAVTVLYLYLDWPFQGLFLEMTQKLWSFMTNDSFTCLLLQISRLDFRGDFDYRELFRKLWMRIPHHLKGRARKDKDLRMKITLWVGEIEKMGNRNDNNEAIKLKRNAGSDTDRKNTWIKKNRKL